MAKRPAFLTTYVKKLTLLQLHLTGGVRGSILTFFDLEQTLSDAAEEAVKDAAAEAVRAAAREHATEAVATVAGDTAKVFASAFVGPVLSLLLRTADSTAKKLSAIVQEPFLTGTSVAQKFLHMQCVTEADYRRRDEKLREASAYLDKAYTYAETSNNRVSDRFCIRLYQGMIECSMSQPSMATALTYLEDCVTTIKSSYNDAYAQDYTSVASIVALELIGTNMSIDRLSEKPAGCSESIWLRFLAGRERQRKYQDIITSLRLGRVLQK